MGTVAQFLQVWSPAYETTINRVRVREVTQGGNQILAAVPLSLQMVWAGGVFSKVAEVSQGPLKAVAQFFRIVCNPLVGFPLSIFSCAVRERFYESSVGVPVEEQVCYFERGERVYQPIPSTIPIKIGSEIRYFNLGNEITHKITESVEVEKEGKKRLFRYEILNSEERFDTQCREVEIEGKKLRVRLLKEVTENYAEIEIGGKKLYYLVEGEGSNSSLGTVCEGQLLAEKHYQIGKQLAEETPNCIKIKVPKGYFHYETGVELSARETGCRSLVIGGKIRHFSSVKHISSPAVGLAGVINQIPKLPFKVPTRLSRFTVLAMEWVNKHTSNIVRLAVIISGFAFAILGCPAMAAGTLLPVTYEYLDHDLGIIPRKMSLFIERWLSPVSMVGLLLVGSLIAKVMAAITLVFEIPSLKLWTHYKLAGWTRSLSIEIKNRLVARFTPKTISRENLSWQQKEMEKMDQQLRSLPTLKEADAPLNENRHLTLAQIKEIFDAKNEDFEFNPSHFTKIEAPFTNLPKNTNFQELIKLWDQQGSVWVQEETYQRLLPRLIDDKKFIQFIQTKFPQAKIFKYYPDLKLKNEENTNICKGMRAAHKKQIEVWIEQLAKEKNCTKQVLLSDWVKQQLVCFVGKLEGTRAIQGGGFHLSDTIENISYLLPFLLDANLQKRDLEDALIKLATEGGDYCAIAMRRVSSEVLEGFTIPFLMEDRDTLDPQKFEKEVRFTLQKMRMRLVDRMYKGVSDAFRRFEAFSDTADDIHFHQAFKQLIARGFYGLSKEEMGEFSITQLLLRESVLLPAYGALIEEYQKSLEENLTAVSIVKGNLKRNKMLEYLRCWAEKNKALSFREKEELLKSTLSNSEDNMIEADNYPKWGRLTLFALGIIRKKRKG